MLIKSVYLNRKKYDFIAESYKPTDLNTFTVLVGSNGTGKSTLLRTIANCIKNNLSGEGLSIPFNYSRHLDVVLERGIYTYFGPKSESSSFLSKNKDDEIITPPATKAISVSSSPFDKFPLVDKKGTNVRYHDDENYHYIGLKQSKNILSKSNLLNLLLRTYLRNSSFFNKSDIFKVLGLSPHISFEISTRLNGLYHQIIWRSAHYDVKSDTMTWKTNWEKADLYKAKSAEEIMSFFVEKNIDFKSIEKHKRGMTNEQFKKVINDLGFSLKVVKHYLLSYECISRANINEIDSSQFESLLFLLDNDFINVSDVYFRDDKGFELIKESDLSSGQKCIILTMLNIGSVIKDNSVICIDEPEISLHPRWQKEYIGYLTKLFDKYKNCHFIIATHSPLIVSEFSQENCFVLSMEKQVIQQVDLYQKNSSDFQLAEVFGVAGNNNEYLNRLSVSLLSSLSKNGTLTATEQDKLKMLKNLSKQMEDDDHVKDLIEILVSAWRKVNKK
ncbi:AAA family ATPase [Pseudoalteromonas obscura]|uniref:AAA family ATPase n=1 Tax=Pseudoalteromonas obscura TaxID=3048491 RepID=A0ABT7EJM6_9GAMM|nr:AAA family ATPase [Pseudoalteromonas sp. P94(2023)]MDK2595242.1 AAA family ATPase [Pseudoalteromonas sp. P94(2023)]